MANLFGSYDPNAEAQADLGKLPTGEYLAVITDSDMKPTNDNTGEYLELIYEVIDGPLKGRKHWERLNLKNASAQTVEIANRQFASLREAIGVPNPRDSQELHNKPHIIRVEFYPAGSLYTSGSRKGKSRDRDEATIKSWKKHEGALPAGGTAPSSAPAANNQPASPTPPWANKAA
ncbi:DUF669 domain-containing protein [Luteibacter sp. E-22]|uniref:DUF669 domain-containing protein n=1 Tax=Luteibacter sp. E-22 TaxID=3404050 RepID=UPI003CEDF9D7